MKIAQGTVFLAIDKMQLTRFEIIKVEEGERYFPFFLKTTDVRINQIWLKLNLFDEVSWKWFHSRKIHILSAIIL